MKNTIVKRFFILAAVVMVLSFFLPGAALAVPPAAPSGLLAITINAGRVDVHWNDNSLDETGFNVERAPDIGGLEPGTYMRLGPNPSVTENVTVFSDTTVVSNTAYWYRVSAVNADGSSFPSNQVRIITPSPAPAISLTQPSNMVIQSGASNAIEAMTNVSGSSVATAEYQFIADNAPGVFEAHDILNPPLDLTIPVPRAASPVNNTQAVPANLPAGAICEFEIRGTVASVNGQGEWQIGSPAITVYDSLNTIFVGHRAPIAGDAVKIFAYRTATDGPLVAKSITFIAPAQPMGAPAVILSFLLNGPFMSVTGPVTGPGYLLSGEIWNVGTGMFRVDAPDFPAYIDNAIGPGTNVTVRFATPAEPANIARNIFRQITKAIGITTDGNPVFDNTPVPLDVPAGTWLYAIVDGVVNGLDLVTGTWTVGDEMVRCYQTAVTLVEPATVGDEVLVYCRRTMTPGPLVIEQVNNILPGRLILPFKGTAVETHLMYNGVIQSMGPNTWTVGGQTFIVDDPEGKARIDPMPFAAFAIGNPVTVEFEHVGEVLPDPGLWEPLASQGGGTWSSSLDLPAVPADTTGTLFLRVTDVKQYGSTSATDVTVAAMPTAPPDPPTLDTIQQTDIDTVEISWTPAATGDSATSFTIERAPDMGGAPGAFAPLATVAASPHIDNTAAAPSTYWYQIIANNIIGPSTASNSMAIQILEVPAMPTDLAVAVLTATTVQLTWTDNAGNEDGYRIESDAGAPGVFATVVDLPAGSTSYVDTIAAGSTHSYRVVAFSATFGNSAPSTEVAISYSAPAAPGGPTITVNAAAPSVTLDWTDNATNETGYLVQRAPDNGGVPGAFADIATLPANSTTYTDTTIATGVLYWYQVIAQGTTDGTIPDSAPTTPVSVGIPVPPANLQYTVTPSPVNVNLTWDDTPVETGYRIERALDTGGVPGPWSAIGTTAMDVVTFIDTTAGGATFQYRVIAVNDWGESAPSNVVAVLTAVPPAPMDLNVALATPTEVSLTWTDVDGETGYRVESNASGNFTQVGADLPAETTTFSDAVSSNSTHSYRVIAFNIFGPSVPSDEVAISYAPPSDPSNVTLMVNIGILIRWTDNSFNESGFEVQRADDTGGVPGAFAPLATVPANATSSGDLTAVQGNTYWYRVIALGPVVGDSNATAPMSILYDIPGSPSALMADSVAYNSVMLSWMDNATNESGFIIQRSTDNVTFAPVGTVLADVTAFDDTTVSPLTTYYYRVFAGNGLGNSVAAAGPIMVTTPMGPPANPSGLAASGVTYNQVTLNWTDNSNDENGFRISRSIDGTTFTEVGTVGANVTTFTDSGVGGSITYYYVVTAYNANGDSGLAGPITVATPAAPAAGGGFGGGGGGGGGGLLVTLTGLTSTTSLRVDGSGYTLSRVDLESMEKDCQLIIPSNTRMVTASGTTLRNIVHSHVTAPAGLPGGYEIVGSVHEFGPAGATFSSPISLRLHYTESELPSGVAEARLMAAVWDGNSWQLMSGVVDTTANTLTISIGGFSAYALVAQLPSAPPPPAQTTTTPPAVTTTPPAQTTTTPPAVTTTPPAVTTTPPAQTTPTTQTTPSPEATEGTDWVLIGAIAGGVIVLAVVATVLISRRRRYA